MTAQSWKAEPVGFTGALAAGCEDGRWCQAFCSEQMDK